MERQEDSRRQADREAKERAFLRRQALKREKEEKETRSVLKRKGGSRRKTPVLCGKHCGRQKKRRHLVRCR